MTRQQQRRQQADRGRDDDDICIISAGSRKCTQAAVATVHITCPEEKTDTGRLCESHVAWAQAGRMQCGHCDGSPHSVIVVRVRWDR